MPSPRFGVAEIEAFLAERFPQLSAREGEGALRIREVTSAGVGVTLAYDRNNLRPGGTISGPAMVALADYAAYALVLAFCGLEDLSVTSSLSIQFLRKPPPGDLMACARPLRLGRRLAVCSVSIYADIAAEQGEGRHAIMTQDEAAAKAMLVAEAHIVYALPSSPRPSSP